MKTYTMTTKTANRLAKTNAEYLFYADGSKITSADLENSFVIEVCEDFSINLAHKNDDFRIENINLDLRKSVIEEKTEVTKGNFSNSRFHLELYGHTFFTDCNGEMIVELYNGAEQKIAGQYRINGSVITADRNGNQIYPYSQPLMKKDFINLVQSFFNA